MKSDNDVADLTATVCGSQSAGSDGAKSSLMRLALGLVLSILILVPSKSLRAQIAGSGAIQGRIVDPTGAVIPVSRAGILYLV